MKNVLFPRFSDGRLWAKVSLGTLLMFVPLVNILAFGYLYRFARDPHHASDGGVQLPEWNDPVRLLVDGLRLLCFTGIHQLGAMALAWLAAEALWLGSFGHVFLCWPTLFPLTTILTLPVFLTCLMLYFPRERFRDCLCPATYRHYLRFFWWPMVWPALGFVGLQCTCWWALYGLAWFLGYGVVFASFNELLRHFGDRIYPFPPRRRPNLHPPG
ncbi:MAG: DUF4013 domain-containing protein [Puniceicoccales bacterium]|nr:DUF4013 domain-containing protein [Puniceicoccales bacterium]